MYSLYYTFLLALGNLKKLLFINQYKAGKNFKLYVSGGILGGKEKIIIGNDVELHGWLISDGGKIFIKDHAVIHKGTVIRAMESVTVGEHCDIGGECAIQDHNSMSLDYKDRRKKTGTILHSPVDIGDDVWIGRKVTVLKGVKIGDKAIIGTMAVVTNNIPAFSVAAGNPAKVVKTLSS